jgi:hypothetical protein
MSTVTPGRTRAQVRLSANRSIAVYDGSRHVGDVIERDHRHHAYTSNLLGTFKTRAEAMRAFPARRFS